jgi:hypothetical protein
MSIFLWGNNDVTNLADDISDSDTTMTVTTGTGSIFPAPGAGEILAITILDAATQLTWEIVYCTNITGDVLTIIRGEENTAAIAWTAGAIVTALVTAGGLTNCVQTDELQNNTSNYAVGAGTGNAITATIASNLTTIPDGFVCYVSAPAANTGATTLTLTLGSTLQSSVSIVKNDQVALVAGDIPAQYYPIELIYSAEWNKFVMNNPTFAVAGTISGGDTNELLIQTGVSTTGFVAAPSIDNSVLTYYGGNVEWDALPTPTTALNIYGGAQYNILYQTAASTTGFVPVPSVAGTVLSFTGSGFAWAGGMQANVLQTTNYKVFETGGRLYFQYQGTNIASLDNVGNWRTLLNIVSNIDPTSGGV